MHTTHLTIDTAHSTRPHYFAPTFLLLCHSIPPLPLPGCRHSLFFLLQPLHSSFPSGPQLCRLCFIPLVGAGVQRWHLLQWDQAESSRDPTALQGWGFLSGLSCTTWAPPARAPASPEAPMPQGEPERKRQACTCCKVSATSTSPMPYPGEPEKAGAA